MTDDWKLILKVVLGCSALILIIIFGLSKMAGSNTLIVDQNVLLNEAKLIKENGETKVIVVNFSDMQCPVCKTAHESLKSLYNTAGVKMVFRYFPLSIHKYASISAKAVEAARQMGKGFEMIDLLFEKQEEWSIEPKIEDKLIEYAVNLGLDGANFREKLNSGEVATAVQQDINVGDSLRLSGTPTIYVNGEQVAPGFVMAKVNEILNAK